MSSRGLSSTRGMLFASWLAGWLAVGLVLRKLSVLVTVMLQIFDRLVMLIDLYRHYFRGSLKAFPWLLVICLISCSSVWSAPDA